MWQAQTLNFFQRLKVLDQHKVMQQQSGNKYAKNVILKMNDIQYILFISNP